MENRKEPSPWPILALLGLGLLLLRYGLGLVLPFLGGLALAMGAEPAVRFLCRRTGLTRPMASFLGVTVVLLLLAGAGLLICAGFLRWLGRLSVVLPDLEQTASQGLLALEDWLVALAQEAPEGVRPLVTKAVLGLFDSGSDLYAQAMGQLPALATGLLSRLTGGALGLGTGILAAYLISARLPRLREWGRDRMPKAWKDRYLPALGRMKTALGGWLRAQAALMGLTFGLVWAGLLVMGVSHALLWALGIALVDAVPMLGTGLVLVPWSLVCFVNLEPARAVGMLALFGAATVVRTVLEPRLLGRELGLDPLVTLLAMYLGYSLLGFPGLILAPLLAVTATQLYGTLYAPD